MSMPFDKRNRGFALLSALILLVALTMIAITVAYRNTMDELMAANQRDYVNAMTVAESGIEDAWSVIRNDTQYVNGDVWGATLDGLALGAPYTLFSAKAVSGGSYDVTVRPTLDGKGDKVMVVNSFGAVRDANREIEIVLELRPTSGSSRQYAILTSDDIFKISGNPVITGPYADVHTNQDMYISGNPIIAGSVTASGVIAEGEDKGVIGGEVSGGAPLETIPEVYPPDWVEYSMFYLTWDCKIYQVSDAASFLVDQNGNVALPPNFSGDPIKNPLLKNISDGSQWPPSDGAWKCSSGDKWTVDLSKSKIDGFYYIEGNVDMSGSMSSGSWWNTSIVAEGYIFVQGVPRFRPYGWDCFDADENGINGPCVYDLAGEKNPTANAILLLAGNDLMISGDAVVNEVDGEYVVQSGFQIYGIIATHREIKINGNPYLEGTIIAENALWHEGDQESASEHKQKDESMFEFNELSGNFYLKASATPQLNADPAKELTVTAWREMVN